MHAEAGLIDAARQGDRGAIVRLLTTCQPDLKRFARRTCSTTEDAEEAVQAALWQLYRRIGALRTAATFATWMFRIVERECFRLFRGRSRAESLEQLEDDKLPAAPGRQQDLQMDLALAIGRLGLPYREVLILRDVHELSTPEVAARLGLSIEAVKSRLHRARAAVRERLLASGYRLNDDLQPSGEPQGGSDVL